MSPFRSKTKLSVLSIVLGLCVLGVFWFFASFVRKFQSAELPLYGDTVSLTLSSKAALIKKVTALQTELAAKDASLQALSTLTHENETLKAELGREDHVKGVLARVITPNDRSLYNTIMIDVGANEHIAVGAPVYAFGAIALGTISEVRDTTATVLLYSAPKRETIGTITGSDTAVTLIGRGAGEYEVRMPRDLRFEEGSVITEQSLRVHPIATIQKIVTDPRDPFQRLLAKAPVNLQTMKWVVVK